MTALRRLRFPISDATNPKTDEAARTALAAMGLLAATLMRERGCDLRSRCQLFPTEPSVWELLDQPGQPPQKFKLSAPGAIELFKEAVTNAEKAGLPYMTDHLNLTPSPQLFDLVRKSQELAVSAGGIDAEDA